MAVLAPQMVRLVMRFGTTRRIVAGLLSTVAVYTPFLPIGLDSGYQRQAAPGEAAEQLAVAVRLAGVAE